MACCENTYNLGCFDSCAVVTLPILFPSDGQYTLFFNGTNNIKYKVVGVSGEPFIVDATLLNSDSTYTFYVVNNSGVRVVFDIDGVDYDCFKIKIETYFNIDATDEITPSVPCTLMCQETYDPMHESKDIFDYNNLRVKAVADGTTITGDGTAGNPFVAIGGGGGIDSVQAGTNIIIDNSDPSNPIINATFSQEGKYLISGGAAWSGTGLTYDVTALTYFFNGNKISLATQVTLAVADPTNNRLDAIVVDEAGVVSVIQGTASVNPITPPIPEEQLLVQYILVEAGLASPSVSNENIYLDDPAGSWTLSTYTTGAPTGTLVFNGTTSPKEGINHIQADADKRLGARFVRATSFDAFQYTVLQVWVRFTGTNVDSNKSLNVRFENSVGTLVGNTLNLFNYGIQRNVLNTWQLAVIPITAFGSLPSTVKGFRAIMIGGTVGVTRQWDMDWILLSDSSVPNVEVPKINFFKDDVTVASQSGLNLKAGTNIGITAVNDVINNRVEYVVDALGGGGLTCADLPTCPIIISMANDIANKSDIGHTHTFASLTSKPTTLTGYGITDAYPLVGNPSAFIDATALLPYLTIASASATYQPILVSGTNIKTINGSSVLGAGDLTISGLPPQSGNNGKYLQTDGTNASWQNVSANVPINTILSATGTNTINNANYKQTWQWNSVTNGGGLLIDSNSTSAIAGDALVEIKRSGAITGFQKTVTLKLSNAITSVGGGNNPIALEIETIGGGNPIGINFKASAVSTATQINLENSPFGQNTGINMGNQFVKFGGGGFTGIGTDGSSIMRYNCNGGQHTFGTTGSSKFGISDYVFSSTSPFTINRRTASPANDWELIFGGAFSTPNMLAYATEANSIRANAGVLSFAGDTGLTGGWALYTPTYIMAIHGGTKNVGIGTITPNASALLDLESTTKGLAIPTMTSAQASAIATPKKSLMLYVTDTNGTFTSAGWWGYNGTIWKLILAE